MKKFVFVILLFITPNIYAGESTFDKTTYNVAVFNFYNETGNLKLDVVQYTIREKLHNELEKLKKFKLVSPKKINERVLKRNLDIRNNIKQPRILQYIGGLVNSDILVIGEFMFDKELLTVGTYLIDAVEGRLMRHYRYSGRLGQIDIIVKRVVGEIDTDTTTWKNIGGFTNKNTLAHHIGEMVAENEEEDLEVKTVLPAPEPRKINITRLLFKTLKYPLVFKLECVNEINNLFNKDLDSSKLKNWVGWVYFRMGDKSYQDGDVDKAFDYWDKTLQLIPKNESIFIRIAQAYKGLKLYNEAIEMYMSCIHINPDNIEAYTGISNIYFEKRSYSLAVFYLGQALERNPGSRKLYLQLAEAYILNKRYDKAISTLEQGLKQFPGNIQMSNMLKRCIQQTTINQPALSNN